MNRLNFRIIIFILILCVGCSYAAILVTNQSATYTGPTTTISFRLNTYAFVTIDIKNVATDSVVKNLNIGFLLAGVNNVLWDGTDNSSFIVPDGDYYATIRAAGFVINTYSPIRLTALTFTNGAGLAFNKNTADTAYFGRLYATDWSTDSIYMYYPDATFIRSTRTDQSWGAYAPFGIDVDNKSVVWISDRSNRRMKLFTSELNFLREIIAGGMPRMDICVTGDTTNGALYMVWGETTTTISRIEKANVVNGIFDPFQYICPIAPDTTTLRAVLAMQDNATVYTAQINAAPAVKQFTGTNYTYTQTGWTTAVDSAFALDFTPDGQYLWVSSLQSG